MLKTILGKLEEKKKDNNMDIDMAQLCVAIINATF